MKIKDNQNNFSKMTENIAIYLTVTNPNNTNSAIVATVKMITEVVIFSSVSFFISNI
jgi:hypothetical protein